MESTSLGSMKQHVGNISFVTFKMTVVVSVGVNVSRGLSLSYGAFFFVVATTFFGTFDVRFNLLTTQHALPENTMEAVSELVLVVTDVLQQLDFFLALILNCMSFEIFQILIHLQIYLITADTVIIKSNGNVVSWESEAV